MIDPWEYSINPCYIMTISQNLSSTYVKSFSIFVLTNRHMVHAICVYVMARALLINGNLSFASALV